MTTIEPSVALVMADRDFREREGLADDRLKVLEAVGERLPPDGA